MHCTALIPDLILPRELGAEPYRGLRTDALATLLARGVTTMRPAQAYEEWLCDALGVAKQQDAPVAALMLLADGGDPGTHYWLRADPVHVRADRNRLVMAGHAQDIEAAEAHAMIAALNRHFREDGIEFLAPVPQRWYVRSTEVPRLVTTSLARAMNRSVEPHLPRGEDALAWHRITNEAQMILHAHPVNAAREERGAQMVNSIWLWGGGVMPVQPSHAFDAVWSDDGLARALAAASDTPCRDLPHDCATWLAAAAEARHLLILHAPSAALLKGDVAGWRNELAMLEASWFAPLAAALRSGKVGDVSLIACNIDNLLEATVTRSGMRRFWRRGQPLANYTAAA